MSADWRYNLPHLDGSDPKQRTMRKKEVVDYLSNAGSFDNNSLKLPTRSPLQKLAQSVINKKKKSVKKKKKKQVDVHGPQQTWFKQI